MIEETNEYDELIKLSGKLFKLVTSLENDGIGSTTLKFTNKKGEVGAVIVIGYQEGSNDAVKKIETITDNLM